MAARSKDDLRIGTHTGNSIDAAGATAIAGALHVNTSISKLLLHSECAAAAAAVCVCVCVRVCSATQGRASHAACDGSGASDNTIGARGATAFAEALKVNTSLTKVDLYGECAAAWRARILVCFRACAHLMSLSWRALRVVCWHAHASLTTSDSVGRFHAVYAQGMPLAVPGRLL